MTFSKIATLIALLICPSLSLQAKENACPVHILYLAHTGNMEHAIRCYQEFVLVQGCHDTEFLEQLGLKILEQGFQSHDPEKQLMALYGAGIALNEKAIPLLAEAIGSKDPRLQLVALNFLSKWQNEDLNVYLAKALRSNYLLIRLQAASQIALQRHKAAFHHLESLMAKLDPELWVLFPQLFASIGDAESTKMLIKLLNHKLEDVRMETINSIVKAEREDLLPKLRCLASHGSQKELEACAHAFGHFRDEASLARLLTLTASSSLPVALSALKALCFLGKSNAYQAIEMLALKGDLYAICALAQIPGADKALESLILNSDIQVRVNAALALLEKRHQGSLIGLKEILIKDNRDLAFSKVVSPGKALYYWKVVPSASQNFDEGSQELEESLAFREDILIKAMDLPEESFLTLVELIFKQRQSDLVPIATALLEQLQSKRAIQLLKSYHQCIGEPLIRNYCNLALCRLGEEGPYADLLWQWLKTEASLSFIQLRPILPWSQKEPLEVHNITLEEKSRLLLEGFQVFAQRQDAKSIDILLEAIKSGNSQNRYALAGLLMRASM